VRVWEGATVPKDKVLIVDDEADNIEFVARTFRNDFEVLTAKSGNEGLALLRSHPDIMLIISDQRMPGMTGSQFLSEVFAIAPASIRILMTGYSDEEAIVEAVNYGKIWSYVRKPVSPDQLRGIAKASVEVFHLSAQNRTLMLQLEEQNRELAKQKRLLELSLDERSRELLEVNRQLSELAARDGLTGLYNHRYFHERAFQEVSRAQRYGSPVSLLFMDIDNFKHYNDSHGHPQGDELLKQVAKLLSRQSVSEEFRVRLRDSDLVARYGGEEFVVLLPETPKSGALIAAERLREAIAGFDFRAGTSASRVTVSFGVATFPDDASSKDALVVSADQALYEAKRSGRNQVKAA
jgi:two-component system, cell cycle response regulator